MNRGQQPDRFGSWEIPTTSGNKNSNDSISGTMATNKKTDTSMIDCISSAASSVSIHPPDRNH